jgi:hypothetical protein
MKVPEVTLGEEMAGSFEWLGRPEILNASFFVWGFADGEVHLAIASIGCVDGLEGNKLRWEQRKIGILFFIAPRRLVDAFNLIQCTG